MPLPKPRKWRRRIKPDHDVDVFELLHALAGRSHSDVARSTYISPTTVSRIRKGYKYGGTRYPQHITMKGLAAAAGLEYRLVRSNLKPRSHK